MERYLVLGQDLSICINGRVRRSLGENVQESYQSYAVNFAASDYPFHSEPCICPSGGVAMVHGIHLLSGETQPVADTSAA